MLKFLRSLSHQWRWCTHQQLTRPFVISQCVRLVESLSVPGYLTTDCHCRKLYEREVKRIHPIVNPFNDVSWGRDAWLELVDTGQRERDQFAAVCSTSTLRIKRALNEAITCKLVWLQVMSRVGPAYTGGRRDWCRFYWRSCSVVWFIKMRGWLKNKKINEIFA